MLIKTLKQLHKQQIKPFLKKEVQKKYFISSEFLKNTIEIKIDRIIKISSDELIDIINFLGSLKLNNKNIIEKKKKFKN